MSSTSPKVPKKILVKYDENLPALATLKKTYWDTNAQYQNQALLNSPWVDFYDLIVTIEELDLRPLTENKNHFYYIKRSVGEFNYFLRERPSMNSICGFCKKNNEKSQVYEAHQLYDKGKISCPMLRGIVCPLCFATGDVAHTLKYCPKLQRHQTKQAVRSQRIVNKRRSSSRSQDIYEISRSQQFCDLRLGLTRSRSLDRALRNSSNNPHKSL